MKWENEKLCERIERWQGIYFREACHYERWARENAVSAFHKAETKVYRRDPRRRWMLQGIKIEVVDGMRRRQLGRQQIIKEVRGQIT